MRANAQGRLQGGRLPLLLLACVALAVFGHQPPSIVGATHVAGHSQPSASLELPDDQIRVYRHLLEDDDFLVVARYNIPYATIPSESATATFLLRLMNGATELGVAVPYSFNDLGYNHGVVSVYFSAADAPAWSGAFDVVLAGNPMFFDAPVSITRTLNATHYTAGATQAAEQELLRVRVIEVAKFLEGEWAITLLAPSQIGETLSIAAGEPYFTSAIPGLQEMAPNAFSVRTTDPDYTAESFGTTTEDAARTRFDGQSWINPAFDQLGTWVGVSGMFVKSMLLVSGMAVALACSFSLFKDPRPGFLAVVPILAVGGWAGFIPLQVLLIIVLGVAGLGTGYVLFLSRG